MLWWIIHKVVIILYNTEYYNFFPFNNILVTESKNLSSSSCSSPACLPQLFPPCLSPESFSFQLCPWLWLASVSSQPWAQCLPTNMATVWTRVRYIHPNNSLTQIRKYILCYLFQYRAEKLREVKLIKGVLMKLHFQCLLEIKVVSPDFCKCRHTCWTSALIPFKLFFWSLSDFPGWIFFEQFTATTSFFSLIVKSAVETTESKSEFSGRATQGRAKMKSRVMYCRYRTCRNQI